MKSIVRTSYPVLPVYYNDIPVGTVCCRIEVDPKIAEKSRLYIMTMGVLAPYRSRTLGTKALQKVIDSALAHNKTIKDPPSSTPPAATAPSSKSSDPSPPFKMALTSFYMHVQTSNVDARRFYERNGFIETGVVEGYYKKLEPHDAWILEKTLGD